MSGGQGLLQPGHAPRQRGVLFPQFTNQDEEFFAGQVVSDNAGHTPVIGQHRPRAPNAPEGCERLPFSRLASLDQSDPLAHETSLVDALQAAREQNHRLSIMNAAFAIELAAGHAIRTEYERLSLLDPHPENMRFHSVIVNANKTQIDDPVYKSLSRKGSSFRILLHELSMYVLRKSLLLDRKDLYDTALLVYASRNALVHGGNSTTDTSCLDINEDGESVAIKTALDIFEWFGLPKPRYSELAMIEIPKDIDSY